MRKALVVGINYYSGINCLFGCKNDAENISKVLERHGDGSKNFDLKLMQAESAKDAISKQNLKEMIEEVFRGDNDISLFYFAGHGHIDAAGGYICASDKDGLISLEEIIQCANKSKTKNRIILLDSCYSGIAGDIKDKPSTAELKEGTTILTASTAEQYAAEADDTGIFTTLLVDALEGAACNLLGDITPGSVYAHIDQSLGPWEQRPVFKTNVKSFVSIRKVPPPINLTEFRKILELFPSREYTYKLDPTYEPERSGTEKNVPAPVKENTEKFALLQKFNRLNLVIPIDAPHMWHAAMNSKACKLTALGEHYRRLVERKRI